MELFENDELVLLSNAIRDFSSQEIAAKVVDLESLAKPDFPREAVDRLAELGFLRGPAPEEIGSGMDRISTVVVLSELAEASAGFAAIAAAHLAALDALLTVPGGVAVIEGLSAGGARPLLGVCLEREVWSLGAACRDGRYISMPTGDKVDAGVLFTGEGEGMRMLVAGGAELKGCDLSSITLSGCDEMPVAEMTVSDDRLQNAQAAAVGEDAARALDAMTSSLKLYFSAIMQGCARSATSCALDYAGRRRQSGRAIVFHQNVRKKLVEMEVMNQAMASFLYRAACNGSGGGVGLVDMLCSFTREHAEEVVNEAIQTLGGYGYTREYGLEKKLKDVKTLQALLPTCLTDWLGVRK